jgi:hypothetical protein
VISDSFSSQFGVQENPGVGDALNQVPQLYFTFATSELHLSSETVNCAVGLQRHSGFRVAFQKNLMETIRSFRPGPALSGIRVEDSPESMTLPED